MLSQSGIKSAWGPRCSGPYVTFTLHGGGRVTMKAAATEALKAFNACLQRWNYRSIASQTGAQNCRQKVGGGGWSIHAYGAALDINWTLNPYGGSRHHIPSDLAAAICRIRTNNGKQVWNWGGYWRGTRDWMHFELVCSPRDLATGINWNTVAGAPARPKPAPIDWGALRRWTAGVLAERVKTLPALHDKVRGDAIPFVKVLQEALNLVKDAKLKVDGDYGVATYMHVADFQNSLKSLGIRMPDPVGYFGDHTKVWLVKALTNIRDRKAP